MCVGRLIRPTGGPAIRKLITLAGALVALVAGFAPVSDPEPRVPAEVPTTSPESAALSEELRRRGFGFVGPTTMHALMEALGVVDDHLVGCHRSGVGASRS